MSVLASSSRFHPHRTLGRHRDHRGLDFAAAARRAVGSRGGPPGPVHQQPQADRTGRPQLLECQQFRAAGLHPLRPVGPGGTNTGQSFSALARMLPFLEQNAIYNAINFNVAARWGGSGSDIVGHHERLDGRLRRVGPDQRQRLGQPDHQLPLPVRHRPGQLDLLHLRPGGRDSTGRPPQLPDQRRVRIRSAAATSGAANGTVYVPNWKNALNNPAGLKPTPEMGAGGPAILCEHRVRGGRSRSPRSPTARATPRPTASGSGPTASSPAGSAGERRTARTASGRSIGSILRRTSAQFAGQMNMDLTISQLCDQSAAVSALHLEGRLVDR